MNTLFRFYCCCFTFPSFFILPLQLCYFHCHERTPMSLSFELQQHYQTRIGLSHYFCQFRELEFALTIPARDPLHASSTSLIASSKSCLSKLTALIRIMKYIRISSCNNSHNIDCSSSVCVFHRFRVTYLLDTFLWFSWNGGTFGQSLLYFSLSSLKKWLTFTQSSHRWLLRITISSLSGGILR